MALVTRPGLPTRWFRTTRLVSWNIYVTFWNIWSSIHRKPRTEWNRTRIFCAKKVEKTATRWRHGRPSMKPTFLIGMTRFLIKLNNKPPPKKKTTQAIMAPHCEWANVTSHRYYYFIGSNDAIVSGAFPKTGTALVVHQSERRQW